jgi:L-lactate dehydrogenase (cytochrome)
MTPASIDDHRLAARRRLPRLLFDYLDGGAMTETTLNRNVTDLRDIGLRQRVLHEIGAPDTSLSLFGREWSMPVAMAPIGLSGYFARRGETQAARAALKADVPFTLSTVSMCDLAEVTKAAGAPPWFQLYILRDRGYLEALMQKALALGCPVLMLTVDLTTAGRRWRDPRNAMGVPPSIEASLRRATDGLLHPRWLWDVQVNGGPHLLGNLVEAIPSARNISDFWSWIGANWDATVSWKELDWVRARWPGTLLIKGVMEPQDAVKAVAAGVDGVIVSNHGGRQLDGARSSITALPRVVEAVRGEKPVLVDGGIRNGADILRALSLGATACLVGRAWAWALGGGGQVGVEAALQTLKGELETTMQLTGCRSLAEAGRHLIDA